MYKKVIKCSVGVMAYNEEQNIASLLDALLRQNLRQARIGEIIVVSSGSTDSTDDIVRAYAQNHKKIRLIAEPVRSGKSSAINLFIQNAKHDILIVESADTIPAKDTVERLVRPFNNARIGMTGGRPVPVNKTDTFVGYAVNLLWRLHHNMSIFSPKLGEMVAFRKSFKMIPERSAVDEASIEAVIKAMGMQCLYVSNAFVHNKGPETLKDFVKQRKRIAIGHLWLKDQHNYSVSSNDVSLLAHLYLKECLSNPKDILKITATAKIELYCRLRGFIDFYHKKENPFIWDTIDSSKDLSR